MLLCIIVQHRVIVAGGSTDKAEDLKRCEAFDQLTCKWSPIASLHEELQHSASATLDDLVYLFGSGVHANDAEQYDAVADHWTLLTSILPARQCSLAVACVNSHIYRIGGLNNVHEPTESVHCWKPRERRFFSKSSIPVACHDNRAVSVGISYETLFKLLLQ